VGEVGVTAIKGARRRVYFLSALVEVAAFAFLATKLDDAAEGAIGGVADQAKTTATVGAPLHAILPSLQFCNLPDSYRSAGPVGGPEWDNWCGCMLKTARDSESNSPDAFAAGLSKRHYAKPGRHFDHWQMVVDFL
jgi:hypothetical protein